jgi:hypothetical protein
MINQTDDASILGLKTTGRTHLKGIDDRGPLSKTTGKQGFAALQAEAIIHEKNRLESVAELYCLLSLLAYGGILSGTNSATKGQTTYQFGKGSKADRTEAAHCLPGQILINGHYPDIILDTAANVEQAGLKPIAMSSKLRHLFGRTDITSVEVNDTDSSIETVTGDIGIKPAFVLSTDKLFSELEKSPPSTKVKVLRHAQAGYKEFYDAARLATRTRLNMRLNARLTDATDQKKNQEQILLLLAFMQAQGAALNPSPLYASAFKLLWEEVAKPEPGE